MGDRVYMLSTHGGAHPAPAIALDAANSLVVAVGAASTASAVIDSGADRLVRISTNADAWMAIGSAPTAAADTAGNVLLNAGLTEYILVRAGHKIAVIQDSTGGHLSICLAEKE